MPSGKPGLLVDGPGLLASGRVADGPDTGDLLVAEPFEKEQCGLLFGGRQGPSIELLVERCRKPVHQIPSFASPAAGLRSGHCELLFEIDRFSLNGSSASKGEDEPTRYEDRSSQPYQEDTSF